MIENTCDEMQNVEVQEVYYLRVVLFEKFQISPKHRI
jgi:hypothetical protein